MIRLRVGDVDREGGDDERRAARRTRELLEAECAALAASGNAEDLVLELREPAALAVPGGLGRAVALLASDRSAEAAIPWGIFAGGRPLEWAYATPWELGCHASLLAARESPAATVVPTEVPAVLRRSGRESPATAIAIPGWIVHSFGGRKGRGREELLPLVPAAARKALDVGCGAGALGGLLAARGIRVTGIERDPVAAAEACRRLDRVLATDLDRALAEVEDERFDLVVVADVLEHLPDPAAALRALADRLEPGGELLFSLPNACHAAVLAGLLQGSWDRALEGISAEDHRHYAGVRGWRRLLAACGFEVVEEVGQGTVSEIARAWIGPLEAAGVPPSELEIVQWTGRARLGPARRTVPAGSPSFAPLPEPVIPNPTFAAVLEALLSGESPGAASAAPLRDGETWLGLRDLGLSVRPWRRSQGGAAGERLAAAVRAAVGAGLPVRTDDFAVEGWERT